MASYLSCAGGPAWSRSSSCLCSFVQDPDGLALASRDGPRGRQFDRRPQAEGSLEGLRDASLERFVGLRLLRDALRHLHPHAQSVLVVLASAEDELVVGLEPLNAEQGVLDLRGENVDPAYDEHVIRAPEDPGDAGAGPAAGAWRPIETGQVAGAVPQNGKRLLGRCGQDQLADLPVRQA